MYGFCTTTPIVHNNTHILQNVRTMHFTFRKSAFYCSVTRNLCNQKQQLLLLILHTSGVGSAIAFSLMGYKPPNFEIGTKVMQSQTELRRSALQKNKFELCLVVSCFEKYQDYYTLTKSVGMTDSYVGKRFCPQASLITRHVTSKPALEAKIEH